MLTLNLPKNYFKQRKITLVGKDMDVNDHEWFELFLSTKYLFVIDQIYRADRGNQNSPKDFENRSSGSKVTKF